MSEQKRWECANANCSHSFELFRGSYPTRCPLCRGETFRRIPEPLNCPICAANGWTDPDSCDHTKLERGLLPGPVGASNAK